jgi:hypothetical protein
MDKMTIANARILEAIAACADPDKLRTYLKNSRDRNEPTVADAAFRKLISILPSAKPGTIEHDLWQTIHAFEQVLSEERGRTTRLSRTHQKVAHVGERKTLEDWALSDKRTEGFEMLLERKMPELTGEAIVLRHASSFGNDVVKAASEKLIGAGIDPGTLRKR